MKPANRPPAMSRPPGARSDPLLSPVITSANVIPIPRPARAREGIAEPSPRGMALTAPAVSTWARSPGRERREFPLFGGGHLVKVVVEPNDSMKKGQK